MDKEVYETIMVQKNIIESQMQTSTIILTNETGTFTIQITSIIHVALEPTNDIVFMLSNLEDDICVSIDLSNTSPFPFRSVNSIPS